MKKPSDPENDREDTWSKLIGLGEHSVRKSYYPELQKQLEKLKERVQTAELAAEIGRGLTEERTLRSSLQRCSDALERRTDAAFVRIWTLDAGGKVLELQASSGLHTQTTGTRSRMNIADCPCPPGIVAREKKPLLTHRVNDGALFRDQQWIRQQGIVAFVGYPLLVQRRLVGVVALYALRPMNETMLDTLSAIADQLAVGIERFQVFEAYKSALADANAGHAKINGILRSVADALLVIDNMDRILHMNQAAEALLGTSLVTARNKPVSEITLEPALLDYLGNLNRQAPANQDTDLDLMDKSRNERRIIQCRAARLTGPQAESGLVISLRDVTQDREVARLKTEFIATAAHELRTPLTTIRGFSELVYTEELDRETQLQYLSYVLDKSDALEKIIDELLDLSRIESGRGLTLSCSDWNFGASLERIVSIYTTEFPDYRFRGDFSGELGMIHADHGKILQVLDNLLTNAIKYSPKHTQITISARREDNQFSVKVSDQGIGMTPEQAANCFQKFYRANASDSAVGGLGLGLSIVRHVIESHQGTIGVESRPGQGTTVTFSLPVHPPQDSPS